MRYLALSLTVCIICITQAQENNTSININKFSFKMFKELNNKEKNCFYSPLSIYGALSLTNEGAKNKSREEIEKVLEVNDSKNVSSNYKILTQKLELNKDIELYSSNSIWLSDKLKLKKSYAKICKEYYDANCKNVDFENDKSRGKVRNGINELVKKQTRKQIKEFIKPGVLKPSTGMVLINVLYFKGQWKKSFNKEETKEELFTTISGEQVNCMMMHGNQSINYYEDDNFQTVELPYKDESASMYIILPKEGNEQALETFSYDIFSDIIRSFANKKVDLSIPRFKLEVNYELKSVLQEMGMNSIFGNEADLSGISGKKDLTISKILHSSVIDVTESGTEASSATAVIAVRSTLAVKDLPIVFKADRPFIFVLKEKTTDTILFVGYLAQPSQK